MSYKASNHTEEKIMLAREDKDHQLYEPKPNKKAIRILTVAAYMLCVSLAAIMLSLYYVFFWDPSVKTVSVKPTSGCGETELWWCGGEYKNLINSPSIAAHFLQTSEQVTESEFRKIAGIDKKGEMVRIVNPESMGPSIPTAVINKDRVYDVKEIQMGYPNQVPNQLMIANTAPPPPAEQLTEVNGKDMQSDAESDDTEYQEDEMDFEIEESSGQAAASVVLLVPERLGNGNEI